MPDLPSFIKDAWPFWLVICIIFGFGVSWATIKGKVSKHNAILFDDGDLKVVTKADCTKTVENCEKLRLQQINHVCKEISEIKVTIKDIDRKGEEARRMQDERHMEVIRLISTLTQALKDKIG